MTPNPIALALTLRDYAVVEETTKKVSLIGEFIAVKAPIFPSPPRSFCAYTVLTDGLGECIIELVVTRLESDEEVYSVTQPGHFVSRFMQLKVLFRVREFSFLQPGSYEFVLLVDGQQVAQRRLRVYQGEVNS